MGRRHASDREKLVMNRAERRRQAREQEKAKTATYNLTYEQLDRLIHEKVGEKLEEIRQEAMDDAVNKALLLTLTLPLEVLMDYYWPKTYQKKIPEFTQHVLDYYTAWQNGEIDMEDLKADLWEYAGIRLEESE